MKNEESLTVTLFDSLLLGDNAVIEQFKTAMGRLAGSINAITTINENIPTGLIATAVCSLSSEPPSVIICVNKKASAHDAIMKYGYFGLNLLSPRHADIIENFSVKNSVERFINPAWDNSSFCVPLLRDAPFSMVCKVGKQYDGFTHSIIIGIINIIKMCDEESSQCLLWRGKGLHETTQYNSIPKVKRNAT